MVLEVLALILTVALFITLVGVALGLVVAGFYGSLLVAVRVVQRALTDRSSGQD